MKNTNTHQDLRGLVLAGGRSRRMKQDKAFLQYHDQPQARYCYDLLKQFFAEVYVSVRPDQAAHPDLKGLPLIIDKPAYQDKGPLAGILSAINAFPDKGWFVLAVDLPFVGPKTIRHLIKHRHLENIATCYRSTTDGLPEPLCAILETTAEVKLKNYYDSRKLCPRKFLIQEEAAVIQQPVDYALDNINDPDEYAQAQRLIKTSRHTY